MLVFKHQDVSPLSYYPSVVRKHTLYDLTPANFTEPGFMHNTVYMVISANKIEGDASKKHIDEIVQDVLMPYCGEEAEDWHMDWYVIGGRWAGFSAVLKGTKCYESSSGTFAYSLFDKYDALMNNGEHGPYVIDGVEYIPINGARKKDILWDCIHKFDTMNTMRIFQMLLNEEDRNRYLGGVLPENYSIDGDALYLKSGSLCYRAGESFAEFTERLGIALTKSILPVDAYIDKDGEWHNGDDLMDDAEFMEKLIEESENVVEDLEYALTERFFKYIDEDVEDDEFILVLDTHS